MSIANKNGWRFEQCENDKIGKRYVHLLEVISCTFSNLCRYPLQSPNTKRNDMEKIMQSMQSLLTTPNLIVIKNCIKAFNCIFIQQVSYPTYFRIVCIYPFIT